MPVGQGLAGRGGDQRLSGRPSEVAGAERQGEAQGRDRVRGLGRRDLVGRPEDEAAAGQVRVEVRHAERQDRGRIPAPVRRREAHPQGRQPGPGIARR
ncbi:hypothetical protein AU375_04570 [Methylobacterium radiotolerans]|nr:hypothetical protein AU375_04570 [Methylobacterium radiotolerans]